jgi:putative SOS response-associated peptidase YedK
VCGRYTLTTPNPAEVRARFPIGETVEVRQRFNIAPGDEVLAVTTDRDGRPRGELLRWGLVPSWSKTPHTDLKMINARVETVAERPAFRTALERFRCLIVADGFYEWRRAPSGAKQGFHITRGDQALFAFAGLWSSWRGPDGSRLRTCTILTTTASSAIAPLHDRMPVILSLDDEAAWLAPDTDRRHVAEMLDGLPPSQTALRPVGPAVNDARYDGPECLESPVQEQRALF